MTLRGGPDFLASRGLALGPDSPLHIGLEDLSWVGSCTGPARVLSTMDTISGNLYHSPILIVDSQNVFADMEMEA